jgi:hypothetical protein
MGPTSHDPQSESRRAFEVTVFDRNSGGHRAIVVNAATGEEARSFVATLGNFVTGTVSEVAPERLAEASPVHAGKEVRPPEDWELWLHFAPLVRLCRAVMSCARVGTAVGERVAPRNRFVKGTLSVALGVLFAAAGFILIAILVGFVRLALSRHP